MVEEYRNSQLVGLRRELVFLRDYFFEKPLLMCDPVVSMDIFGDFMEWTKKKASMGGCTEYSSTVIGFGMFMSKIPGFAKPKHDGKLRKYNVNAPIFIKHLVRLQLFSEEEAEWVDLCVNDPKVYNKCHCFEQWRWKYQYADLWTKCGLDEGFDMAKYDEFLRRVHVDTSFRPYV
jgi:hypothetical protein